MTHRVVSLAVVVFACLGFVRAVDWQVAQASYDWRSDVHRSQDRPGVPGAVLADYRGSEAELASASVGQAASAVLALPLLASSESLYQGKPAVWWARRAVQARKDANARKQTILRLRRAQAKDAAHFFSWLAAADCIHRHEANWDHNGPTYDGGMQADASFQRAYGRAYLHLGPAYLWPWWAQLHMAYNGWVVRGWQPWPTRRYCGL